MHDSAHLLELHAELAARMEAPEIIRRETPAFEQRNRQRVAQRELHRRRGCRREPVRAGFTRTRKREADIGLATESTVRFRGKRDEIDPEPLGISNKISQFRGFARP